MQESRVTTDSAREFVRSMRPMRRVYEELGISPELGDVLVTLAGAEYERVGPSKMLYPDSVDRLRAAHDVFRLSKSLSPADRARLAAAFDRFAESVRDLIRAGVGAA